MFDVTPWIERLVDGFEVIRPTTRSKGDKSMWANILGVRRGVKHSADLFAFKEVLRSRCDLVFARPFSLADVRYNAKASVNPV